MLLPSDPAGIIRTALANMDREAREYYTVVIQAKDMAGQVGGLSGSTTINITLTDINDNPPEFPQSRFSDLAIACWGVSGSRVNDSAAPLGADL